MRETPSTGGPLSPSEPGQSALAGAPALATQRAEVPLGDGWSVELLARPRGAVLRVGRDSGGGTLELSISLTDAGPVVRAHAAALEIDSDTDLIARCDRFRVEARESIELVAGGAARLTGRELDLQATHGSARLRANDDVQLLGEQVLLNCEPAPPMPQWALPVGALPLPSLAVTDVSGDAELARSLKKAD